MTASHLGRAGCAALAFVVASVSAASAQDLGTMLGNLFSGATAPSATPRQADDAYCPPVGVMDGAAAVQVHSGAREPSTLRYQVSIGQLARECFAQEDGSILVKVGVEARALLGPVGSSGRFDVPLTVVLKRGDRILSSKTQRVSLAVPQGDTQGRVVIVQDGLVVPPKTGEYEIDVGLVAGTGAKPERSARRDRRG